jgi:intracellular multiplication protein IcmV
MAFFQQAKSLGSYIFNFRVGKWMGVDQVKQSYSQLYQITLAVFRPEQAELSETFEEALIRLDLTEADIEQRRIEFTRLMIIYAFVSLAIFSYSIWIVYAYKNLLGFGMGFSITIFALTYAFRYHFWLFQIKHRKLGCSLRDWFLDKY